MYVTKTGNTLTIRVVDYYTIHSAAILARALIFIGVSEGPIQDQDRKQGIYSPMGTTKQEFFWQIDLNSIISK